MSEKILNFSVVLRDAGQVEAVLWRETRDMATVAAIDWVEQGQHHDAIVAENLTHLTALLKVESAAVEKVKPTVRELEEILAQDAADVRAENAEALSPQDQSGEDQSSPQASGTDTALYDWENSNLNGNNPNAITARTVAHLVVDSLGASSEASASARSDETVDPLPGEGQESRETCLQNAGLSDDGGLLNETLEASPPPSGLDSQAQPQASSEQSPLHDRPALTDTEYQGLQRFEDKPITTDEIREEIQSYYSDSEPEEIASLPTPVDDKEASEDPARMFSAGINREIDAKDRKPAFMGLFRKEPA